MSSVAIKGHVPLHQAGAIYNCQINSHTILADSEAELFDTIGKVIEPEYLAPFEGNGFTWTFVRDDSAAEYDLARKHPEYRANATGTTTMALGGGIGLHTLRSYIVYPSLATYEAIDWIEANAKGQVKAWTLPCTDQHFYMFEDAKEAMLFKLQSVA
ncbi:hypothetical protein D9M68_709100 [compost metagenome]